jgi:hypothetical protein
VETVTGSDPETTVRLRLWPWFTGGVVIGCPLVVVLPVLTLAASILCLIVALIRRHTRAGQCWRAVGMGFLLPMFVYLGLAALHHV